MKLRRWLVLFSLTPPLLNLISPAPALAQTCTPTVGGFGINTGIGCLPISSSSALINALLSWAFGLAGGVAFILIIVAGFQLTTSAGNPKRAAAAKELLTSALEGLILIVCAVVILNFLGVSVLGLNRLGFSNL